MKPPAAAQRAAHDHALTSPAEAARADGNRRAVIEGVAPEIDCGRFPIKRTVGETVAVEADVFTDGHDVVVPVLLHRRRGASEWSETAMEALVNDRFRAEFEVRELGGYEYTVVAWVDHWRTWRRDLQKKVEAGQDVAVDLLIGAELVEVATPRAAAGEARERLRELHRALAARAEPAAARVPVALSAELARLMAAAPDRSLATRYARELPVTVDRERARCSSWYEMFPRSAATRAGEHGTLRDCERLLPYVADMGFDVLYLPPIHPIGRANRKGKNNTLDPDADDVGSPWAIGSAEGGHKAIHPQLGTLDDFRRLREKANEHGIELALDIAFQAAPDHPYVKEHPEWFRWRPDGTVQYAENPPKKYQDILPFDFEGEAWQSLWDELTGVVRFWCQQGVRIFRVDNPHTKPFPFWEALIADIKREWPESIFLAEAFTRPKVMYRLAKLGFTQSYTYFAWRNAKWELEQYFTELTQTSVHEYFRPNLWPNTPDILTEHLQTGGRAFAMARLVLAATLGASYGIYGPAFELGENRAVRRGSEEYLDSEKYQIRAWDRARPDSLRELIGRVNRIRRDNRALQANGSLRFHHTDNEQVTCYSKRTSARDNVILTVVNLDPHHVHSAWVSLDLAELGVDPAHGFQVHDLLTGARYIWQGPRNFVQLDPNVVPAHVFRVRSRLRTEQNFDYYQ